MVSKKRSIIELWCVTRLSHLKFLFTYVVHNLFASMVVWCFPQQIIYQTRMQGSKPPMKHMYIMILHICMYVCMYVCWVWLFQMVGIKQKWSVYVCGRNQTKMMNIDDFIDLFFSYCWNQQGKVHLIGIIKRYWNIQILQSSIFPNGWNPII